MIQPYGQIPYIKAPANVHSKLARFLAECYAQHGPIFRSQNVFGGGEAIYLVGPEANRFVLTTNRLNFSHRAGWGIKGHVIARLGDGLLSMDPPEHTVSRQVLHP